MNQKIFSGYYPDYGHVQGIATDGTYLYYSLTTALLKTDMDGNLIGSVTGLLGHLGCIAFYDGAVYGSLEYKNDSIGRGILDRIGSDIVLPDAFYVVRFDITKLNRIGMDAEEDGIVTAVRLTDVCEDYSAPGHRWGCSGIDGITGCDYPDGIPALFIAYGIYSDLSRSDNDHQIILRLPLAEVKNRLAPLTQDFAASPASLAAADKYFVYTGNTTYGIQNLEFDPYTNCMYAAVYRGEKPQFPNYAMYVIDLSKKPLEKDGRKFLSLAEKFEYDAESGIYGLNFPHGSTGIIALGNGKYFFSEDGYAPQGYYTNVTLYHYDPVQGFVVGSGG